MPIVQVYESSGKSRNGTKEKARNMFSVKTIDKMLWAMFGVYALAIFLFYLITPQQPFYPY